MKITLFFILLLAALPCHTQQNDTIRFDPERRYTQEYIDFLTHEYRGRVDPYEFKKMLESDPELLGWTRFYSAMANHAIAAKKFDSALYFSDKSIESYENAPVKRGLDEKNLIRTYNLKAYTLRQIKDYDSSIVNYQKALDLTKKHPYKWKSFLVSGIAGNHVTLGNDSLALNYYLEASIDTVYMALPRPAVTTYLNIGNLYDIFDDGKNAKFYYKKGLEKSEKSNFKSSIATLNGSLGELYYNESNIDSALFHFRKAYEANTEYGIPDFHGAEENHEFYKSFIQVHDGDPVNGIKGLEQLIGKLRDTEKITKVEKGLMQNAVLTLGYAYQKQGNSKQYVELLEGSYAFLNKFQQQRLSEDLQNLETKYLTKEKDHSIARLEQDALQQETIINQQRVIGIGLAGLLILLSMLALLFWRQRKLRIQYERENLEQRLLRSQMNPHFLFNSLNTIGVLATKKSEKTQNYIVKLSNLLRLILNNSREEFVELENEVNALNDYLNLQSDFSESFHFTIDVDFDQDGLLIPPMLIQPFVENAIQHGIKNVKNGEIKVSLSKMTGSQLIKCVVQDNGSGYDQKAMSAHTDVGNHKSVSGKIVKERLAILKKKFKVDSRYTIKNRENKSGTEVEIRIPYIIDE